MPNKFVFKPLTDAEVPYLLTMLVDSYTAEGKPTAVTATQQHYRDALSGGFISGIIGYTENAEAAGFALYSWFFETAEGLPGLSILNLYASTALKEGRTVLERQLFSACCAVAAEHKAGAVEWRIDEQDTRAINMAENVGARPEQRAVIAVNGPENVAIAARLTNQPM